MYTCRQITELQFGIKVVLDCKPSSHLISVHLSAWSDSICFVHTYTYMFGAASSKMLYATTYITFGISTSTHNEIFILHITILSSVVCMQLYVQRT